MPKTSDSPDREIVCSKTQDVTASERYGSLYLSAGVCFLYVLHRFVKRLRIERSRSAQSVVAVELMNWKIAQEAHIGRVIGLAQGPLSSCQSI
jgi:hypothetical protein